MTIKHGFNLGGGLDESQRARWKELKKMGHRAVKVCILWNNNKPSIKKKKKYPKLKLVVSNGAKQ